MIAPKLHETITFFDVLSARIRSIALNWKLRKKRMNASYTADFTEGRD